MSSKNLASQILVDGRGITELSLTEAVIDGTISTIIPAGGQRFTRALPTGTIDDITPKPHIAPTSAVDDVVGTANRFSIHDRVAGQLDDPRLGNLQGRFGTDDLQALTTSPNATAYLDVRSGHINVIQEIDGVLLRVTTAADEFRIISVGRVRPAQLTNGSMIPIGSGG